VFRASGLEGRPLESVAILPFVGVVDRPAAEREAEQMWLAFYGEARTAWMTSAEVRERIAASPAGSDRLTVGAESEIWNSGAPSAETARRLARLLGVNAVLAVRIDEWEVVDGGCGVVAMTATLTGADGVRLWSISGLASQGAGRRSYEGNFDWTLNWVRDPRLEPREDDRKLGVALCRLLCRWASSLPDAMFEGEALPPRLAQLRVALAEGR
jgi:hypothetical protein